MGLASASAAARQTLAIPASRRIGESGVITRKAGEVPTTLGAGFRRRPPLGYGVPYLRRVVRFSDAPRNSGIRLSNTAGQAVEHARGALPLFGVKRQPGGACESVPGFAQSSTLPPALCRSVLLPGRKRGSAPSGLHGRTGDTMSRWASFLTTSNRHVGSLWITSCLSRSALSTTRTTTRRGRRRSSTSGQRLASQTVAGRAR